MAYSNAPFRSGGATVSSHERRSARIRHDPRFRHSTLQDPSCTEAATTVHLRSLSGDSPHTASTERRFVGGRGFPFNVVSDGPCVSAKQWHVPTCGCLPLAMVLRASLAHPTTTTTVLPTAGDGFFYASIDDLDVPNCRCRSSRAAACAINTSGRIYRSRKCQRRIRPIWRRRFAERLNWGSTISKRLAAMDRANANWGLCSPLCRAMRSSCRQRSSRRPIRRNSCSISRNRSIDCSLSHVDLLGIHGINNHRLLWYTVRDKGCLAAARELQKQGKVRHVGFSTHGPPDVVRETVQWDGDGGFDYVNLHWYYIYQENWQAIEEATRRDMGVFIISPADKGGMLYRPPQQMVELCQPLHPLVFNCLFCLSHPQVHTLSIGASKPSDFDLQLTTLKSVGPGCRVVAPHRSTIASCHGRSGRPGSGGSLRRRACALGGGTGAD